MRDYIEISGTKIALDDMAALRLYSSTSLKDASVRDAFLPELKTFLESKGGVVTSSEDRTLSTKMP